MHIAQLAVHPSLTRLFRLGSSLLWGCASGFFLALLSSLIRVDHMPGPVPAALFGAAGLAVWRPAPALLLVAATVPIASWTGRHWNGSVAWPEVLAVAFLAGYSARRALHRADDTIDPLAASIYSMTAIVAASLAAQLLVLHATIGSHALLDHVRSVLTVHYFIGNGGFPELDAALRLVEGVLLLHAAASLSRATGSFAPSLVRCVVLGAAAASALTLWRIWIGALRHESPALAFLGYLGALRFNAHYADVNAAGSYYMMALLPALGLSRAARSVPWAFIAALIGLSVLLSGSRAALVAGLAAGIILWWIRRTPPHSGTVRPRVVLALLMILVGGALLYLAVTRNVTPAASALRIRAEFAQTSVRMLKAAPVFGIGIGEFPVRSGDFSSPELLALYPPAVHENAHNSFLQVLSELGLLGFGVFVWVLVAAWTLAARAGDSELLNRASGAGVLAFVITWLAGHPLLIDDPAFSFWLLLGAVAGWGPPPPQPMTRIPASAALASIIALGLLASLPLRVRAELSSAQLEHQGIGLSAWHDSEDGIRYRLAGMRSTVFVPSARAVTLPLRAADASRELLVELRLDGRPANVLRVPGDRWLALQLPLPHPDDDARFRRLDLEVRSEEMAAPVLMVGKVTPR